jgi:hypothetical protein
MFSPCPGYPVPLIGAWRPVDYEMNWLGWHGAEFGHGPDFEADHKELDSHHDSAGLQTPTPASPAQKPAPEPH